MINFFGGDPVVNLMILDHEERQEKIKNIIDNVNPEDYDYSLTAILRAYNFTDATDEEKEQIRRGLLSYGQENLSYYY
jgi:hypothetical protein